MELCRNPLALKDATGVGVDMEWKTGKLDVQYVNHMGSDLTVVNSARISVGNSSQELTDRDKKLINFLARNEHMSPFEHCVITLLIKCPLYIRSQIHRHRTFSYNEISRRYTSRGLEFYEPEVYRKQAKNNKQGSDGEFSEDDNIDIFSDVAKHHRDSLDLYEILINRGVAREQARGVLPQNLMTEFYMTGNLRNWVHFLRLRLDSHAQGEVQEIAQKCADIIKDLYPISYQTLMGD